MACGSRDDVVAASRPRGYLSRETVTVLGRVGGAGHRASVRASPIHRRRGACCVFHGHIPPSKQNRLGKPRRCVRRNPSMSYGPLARALLDSDEASVSQALQRSAWERNGAQHSCASTPCQAQRAAARLTKHQHRLLLTRSNKIRHRRAAGQQRRSNTSARSLTGQLHCATQRRTA